jgi:acyl carrier protein
MNVSEKVKSVIAEQFGVELATVVEEKNLIDFNLDSLDIVEIVMTLEDRFRIKIEDSEYIDVLTVGGIIDLVESKYSSKIKQ